MTPRPKTRKEYDKLMRARATKAYADHRLRVVGPDRWSIRGPDGIGMWAEIISASMHTIIVLGDACDLIFRRWGRPNSGSSGVWWLATSNVDYLSTKLCGRENQDQWNPEIAAEDLGDLIEEAKGECNDTIAERLSEIGPVDLDGPAARYEVYETLTSIGLDDVHNIGMVVPPEVYHARAIAQRIAELLDERGKETGDPACQQ